MRVTKVINQLEYWVIDGDHPAKENSYFIIYLSFKQHKDLGMMKLSEEGKYRRAEKQVKEEKGFYLNLFCYLVIITFFAILNFLTSPRHWWVQWPMLGWGVGIIFHGLGVFGVLYESDWEEKRIKKYMEKY